MRLISTLLIAIILLTGCLNGPSLDKPIAGAGTGNEQISSEPQAEAKPEDTSFHTDGEQPGYVQPPENKRNDADYPEADGDTEAVWMAVGDIMMHMPQLPAAYDKQRKRYNFNPFFEQVKPILEEGDWTLANLETPIAGKSLGYSGFPRFNAPSELAEALKYAGFNIITTANNHALDRGAEGLRLTLNNLLAQGFTVKGTARSKAEADKLTIVKHKGIRMGLLAYTYGTNGIALPKNKPYAVSIIEEATIIRDIGRLREAGADFITVALHFGTEYQAQPNDRQKALARKLIAAGADIIAGSHPHVVQPYETVETTAGDGSPRRGLIIYSMGNFLSNQRGDMKDFGVIYKVRIHKDKSGMTTIGDVQPIPTWVYRSGLKGSYRYMILPLERAVDSRQIKELTDADYESLIRSLDVMVQRITSMAAASNTKK
ncbi:CapA family protein [Paenibacillus sp. sptzw28]|uniref:CapA family protein n=1 Tax=Paenibacillus sp. sptzw28 TaxID=715179 RepID=UPI001C6EAEC1|nr:CapA family protein [Paenibacillus sp. sptzw28]QYR24077.1 CapA family protein [Paenibacillus sp. sptzw28]